MPTKAKYPPRIICRDIAWDEYTVAEKRYAARAMLKNARAKAKPVSLWSRFVAWLNSDV